eukprot:COSAG02_NODE_15786_length_1141_cov_1.238004_1_plen_187_part_00
MIIHKSYSKLELINLMKNCGIKCECDINYNKKEVVEYIKDNYKKFKITNKDNRYNIKNIPTFKNYLVNENPLKKLNTKDKNNIILNAKRIINYCTNNYNLDESTFDSIEDLNNIINEIKYYSYISSVRRALKLFNNNPKLNKKVDYDLPQEIEYDLKPEPKFFIKIRKGIFRYDMLNCKLEVIEEY